MKIFVGLGNPGEKYKSTRHNAGFVVLDRLGGNFEFKNKFAAEIAERDGAILAKPTTFMNRSGEAVAKIYRFYKVKSEDLYVIHDDLDIELGKYKIQRGRGPQLHYGVESIEQSLSTKDFWRVRVGVENREIKGNKGIAGEEYSLQNFHPEERAVLDKTIENVLDELQSVIS